MISSELTSRTFEMLKHPDVVAVIEHADTVVRQGIVGDPKQKEPSKVALRVFQKTAPERLEENNKLLMKAIQDRTSQALSPVSQPENGIKERLRLSIERAVRANFLKIEPEPLTDKPLNFKFTPLTRAGRFLHRDWGEEILTHHYTEFTANEETQAQKLRLLFAMNDYRILQISFNPNSRRTPLKTPEGYFAEQALHVLGRVSDKLLSASSYTLDNQGMIYTAPKKTKKDAQENKDIILLNYLSKAFSHIKDLLDSTTNVLALPEDVPVPKMRARTCSARDSGHLTTLNALKRIKATLPDLFQSLTVPPASNSEYGVRSFKIATLPNYYGNLSSLKKSFHSLLLFLEQCPKKTLAQTEMQESLKELLDVINILLEKIEPVASALGKPG